MIWRAEIPIGLRGKSAMNPRSESTLAIPQMPDRELFGDQIEVRLASQNHFVPHDSWRGHETVTKF